MTADSGPSFHSVDRQRSLDGLVARIRRSQRVALDTEADSLHHYFEKVCLMQVACHGEIFLVDPLADMDCGPLLDALADTVLILHSAENDLRLLRRLYDFVPRNTIFDTLVAAQLLGHERLGMAALVEQFYEVLLPKGGQKSNWSRRPLTPAQLRYAALDVAFLEGLADTLGRQLHELGRDLWLTQSVARMVQRAAQEPVAAEPDQAWRIKGISRFSRHELAVVKQLWQWRDREARRVDLPPFRILDNSTLLELAVWVVAHPGTPLDNAPPLPRHCHGNRRAALRRILHGAHRIPETEWPEYRRRPPSPRPPAITGALRHACAVIAKDLGIAPAVLASRETLETIALAEPRTEADVMACAAVLPWQASLLLPVVQDVLHTNPHETNG